MVKPTNSQIHGTFVHDEKNFDRKKSDVLMLGVAFDLTASYNVGTWHGPLAIIDASYQIEYGVPVLKTQLTDKINIHSVGILEYKKSEQKELELEEINKVSETMVEDVKREALQAFEENKFLMTFGGDHSIPNGIFQAMKQKFESKNVTIIQFDAHTDLWKDFHGQKYSHASIMTNAKTLGFPLIQIGIRDHMGEEEHKLIDKYNLKEQMFFCATMPKKLYEELNALNENLIFDSVVSEKMIQKIVSQIKTKHVYISLDIDVLDSSVIQGTGTPLPHGLNLAALEKIIFEIISFCKKNNINFLGFDLVEVSPQLKEEIDYYDAKNCVSNSTEMIAALIAYKILYWNYLERFR
ncbi:MAG: arginase family protein [archaeon]|nr:arginase family protein [archaeon]